VRIDFTEKTVNVYVRQSWINDALMCNERGRQGMLRPEWSLPNDATILGTAVHAGIASVLLGGSNSVAVAKEELNSLLQEPFARVKYDNDELFSFVESLCHNWEKEIGPTLGNVLFVEKEFEFLLEHYYDEKINKMVHVWGKGTIDCVTDTAVWDWKTSGKRYSAKEKQSQAVQPTMYCAASVDAGWHEYPVQFKYGVLVRGGKAQIVPIHRNESHTDWLREQVRPLVRTACLVGTDYSWVKNDTHYLCSETWCSWWSICKGSKLSPEDMTPKEKA
jgi:hypothetical protein